MLYYIMRTFIYLFWSYATSLITHFFREYTVELLWVPIVFWEGILWATVWHSKKKDEKSSRETKLLEAKGFWSSNLPFQKIDLFSPGKIHKRLTYKLQVQYIGCKEKSNTTKEVVILMAAGLISPHRHIYQRIKCTGLLSEHETEEERRVCCILY